MRSSRIVAILHLSCVSCARTGCELVNRYQRGFTHRVIRSGNRVSYAKGLKFGSECLGPVSTMTPELATCAIAGTEACIWCPNGDIFDLDEKKSPVPLMRSLCNPTPLSEK